MARTSLATGVSESTVKRMSKEYRVEGGFKSPEKRYVKDRVRLYPDDFNRDAIRRIIHDSYLNKDYPTLDSVLQKARSTCVFDGGRTTLSKLLKSMGFRYKKREDGKKYIYEQPQVIEQRHQYLRRMRRNREERRPEVFLDETWTNSHAAPEKLWVYRDGTGGWRRPSGKGERLIIVHAGSSSGWVPNSGKFFRSKKNSGDYHDEMNATHFLEWFEFSLMPNLPLNSLIILDNTKYHNTVAKKTPTKSSTKREIKAWLDNRGISYNPKDLKQDLFRIIQSCHTSTVYHTENSSPVWARSSQTSSHCALNPIEMAWATVKDFIRKDNTTFRLSDVQSLIPAAFDEVMSSKWERMRRHVTKVEDDYWEKDGLLEEEMEEFVISLGGPDSSDDEDDSDNDDYTGDCSSEEDLEDDDYDMRLLHQEEQLLREMMSLEQREQ